MKTWINWALVCLGITLLAGVVLRLLWSSWAWILPFPIQAKYVLHAHSHVALLGWLTMSYIPMLFRSLNETIRNWNTIAWGLGVLNLCTFWAFALQGYAKWSILLSTLHLAASFTLIWVYYGKKEHAKMSGFDWWDWSNMWFVLSSLGPLLLAFGQRMGPDWITFWVSYYLFFQFFGWLLGWSIAVLGEQQRHVLPLKEVLLLMLALSLTFLAHAKGISDQWMWLAFPASVALVWMIGKRLWAKSEKTPSILAKSAQRALALSVLMLMLSTVPGISAIVIDNRLLMIGFLHLFLLTGVSVLMLDKHASVLGGHAPLTTSLAEYGIVVFSWTIPLVVLVSGLSFMLGFVPFFPLQESSVVAGLGLLCCLGVWTMRLRA